MMQVFKLKEKNGKNCSTDCYLMNCGRTDLLEFIVNDIAPKSSFHMLPSIKIKHIGTKLHDGAFGQD